MLIEVVMRVQRTYPMSRKGHSADSLLIEVPVFLDQLLARELSPEGVLIKTGIFWSCHV